MTELTFTRKEWKIILDSLDSFDTDDSLELHDKILSGLGR